MNQDLKKVIIVISSALVIVAILVAIILGSLTQGFTDWSFGKNSQLNVENTENGSLSADIVNNGQKDIIGVEFTETTIEPRILLSAGVAEASANGTVSKTITATVLPETAVDKSVDWTIEWVVPVSDNANISDYLTITPESDGSSTATITAYKGFEGGKAVVTCITRVGLYTANCYITYLGAPTSIGFVINGNEYSNSNEVELLAGTSYDVTLNLHNTLEAVGSKYGTYEITAYGMSGRFTALKKEINNGTVVSSEDIVVNLAEKKVGSLSFDTSMFFNASISGNTLTINCLRSEGSFLLPMAPVRTGTQYEYKGTYTDPRSGGVPDDCRWYIEVKETVSGRTSLIYIDIQSTVTALSLSNTALEF